MIKDLRLHGNLGPVEFFAFVGEDSVKSTDEGRERTPGG